MYKMLRRGARMITIENAKIWRTGNSHVVTIPRVYIVKGIINPGQKYEITIKEEQQ